MATRGVALKVQYFALDTANSVGKTGDGGNHTFRWVKDGTSAEPTDTTPAEVDSTNCPGLYTLDISASEADCALGTLFVKSSTADTLIVPVTLSFDRTLGFVPSAEFSTPPGALVSLENMVHWLYVLSRNRLRQTATHLELYKDDGVTLIGRFPVTESSTEVVLGEITT